MCDFLKPGSQETALEVYRICPTNPGSRKNLYFSGLSHASDLTSKKSRIDMNRSEYMSGPLAWSVVLPFFEAIQTSQTTDNTFETQTRDALMNEFGLDPSKHMGELLIRHRVVHIPGESMEQEFFSAMHMIFAYQSALLRPVVESMDQFPTEPPVSLRFDYWRLLFYVLKRYYRSIALPSSLDSQLLGLDSQLLGPDNLDWYQVTYVVDENPLKATEQMLQSVFDSFYHNIWAGYRLDFLRTILGIAGDLLPEETVNAISLPGFNKIQNLAVSKADIRFFYSIFQKGPNSTVIVTDLLKENKIDGPLYRLEKNRQRLLGEFKKRFRTNNVLVLRLFEIPVTSASSGLRDAQTTDDVNNVLVPYEQKITTSIAALLSEELPSKRITKLPKKLDTVIYTAKTGFSWTTVQTAYKRVKGIILPLGFETVKYADLLNSSENIKEFNDTYLKTLARYQDHAYIRLVHFKNMAAEVAESKRSKLPTAVFLVWNPGFFISTLNMYILSWKDSIGSEPFIAPMRILNLSNNRGILKKGTFPDESTVFSEEIAIREMYSIPRAKESDSSYIKYEDVFGVAREERSQLFFFGLWYAEMAFKGFNDRQLKWIQYIIGPETMLNFLRSRYILPIVRA